MQREKNRLLLHKNFEIKTLKYGYEYNQSHIINANYIVKRTKYFLSDANGHYLRIIIKISVLTLNINLSGPMICSIKLLNNTFFNRNSDKI